MLERQRENSFSRRENLYGDYANGSWIQHNRPRTISLPSRSTNGHRSQDNGHCRRAWLRGNGAGSMGRHSRPRECAHAARRRAKGVASGEGRQFLPPRGGRQFLPSPLDHPRPTLPCPQTLTAGLALFALKENPPCIVPVPVPVHFQTNAPSTQKSERQSSKGRAYTPHPGGLCIGLFLEKGIPYWASLLEQYWHLLG